MRGIGTRIPTKVYQSPVTSSKVLKTYQQGHQLKYRTFSKSRYEATVYINDKPRTGYIHYNDVKLIVPTGNTKIVNPMQVYSYEQMVRDIKALYKANPELITYLVIGKSEYGEIFMRFPLEKETNSIYQWLPSCQKIDGYEVKKILNETTLWFVPMVNPDVV